MSSYLCLFLVSFLVPFFIVLKKSISIRHLILNIKQPERLLERTKNAKQYVFLGYFQLILPLYILLKASLQTSASLPALESI